MAKRRIDVHNDIKIFLSVKTYIQFKYQICHSQGKVKIDKTKIVKNGIQVDGIVQMKVLYIMGNDDMPFYSTEVMMPFNHMVEAQGIRDDSVYYFHTELEQLATSMIDSNEIEVRAVVSLNALVLQCREEKIIESIEEQPLDMEKINTVISNPLCHYHMAERHHYFR